LIGRAKLCRCSAPLNNGRSVELDANGAGHLPRQVCLTEKRKTAFLTPKDEINERLGLHELRGWTSPRYALFWPGFPTQTATGVPTSR
jgi:hypothetical protein